MGRQRFFGRDGHSFSDVARKVVSIINLASVAAVENATGVPVNPLRFRGNLYVSGWTAWHEFDLVGQMPRLSGKTAQLKIVKRIQRCAATDVDPDTGIRDLTIPRTLLENFDHTDCGVYAEVVTPGRNRGRRFRTFRRLMKTPRFEKRGVEISALMRPDQPPGSM